MGHVGNLRRLLTVARSCDGDTCRGRGDSAQHPVARRRSRPSTQSRTAGCEHGDALPANWINGFLELERLGLRGDEYAAARRPSSTRTAQPLGRTVGTVTHPQGRGRQRLRRRIGDLEPHPSTPTGTDILRPGMCGRPLGRDSDPGATARRAPTRRLRDVDVRPSAASQFTHDVRRHAHPRSRHIRTATPAARATRRVTSRDHSVPSTADRPQGNLLFGGHPSGSVMLARAGPPTSAPYSSSGGRVPHAGSTRGPTQCVCRGTSTHDHVRRDPRGRRTRLAQDHGRRPGTATRSTTRRRAGSAASFSLLRRRRARRYTKLHARPVLGERDRSRRGTGRSTASPAPTSGPGTLRRRSTATCDHQPGPRPDGRPARYEHQAR